MARYLPLLAVAVVACGGGSGNELGGFPVAVTEVAVREPVLGDVAAGYLTMWLNDGEADVLLTVSSPDAGRVSLHGPGMVPLDSLVLAPGDTVKLETGGMHLMLEKLSRILEPGDTVTLILNFRRAGPLEVRGPVVALGEAGV